MARADWKRDHWQEARGNDWLGPEGTERQEWRGRPGSAKEQIGRRRMAAKGTDGQESTGRPGPARMDRPGEERQEAYG